MRIIFMGTPDFAVPVLQSLINSRHEVVAVVTQPDRPKGRGKNMQFSPVKECALAHNIPVMQPVNVSVPEVIDEPVSYTHLDVYKRQLSGSSDGGYEPSFHR